MNDWHKGLYLRASWLALTITRWLDMHEHLLECVPVNRILSTCRSLAYLSPNNQHRTHDDESRSIAASLCTPSSPASNTLDILKNKSLTGCWQMIIWALHNFSHFPPTPRRYVFWPLFTVLVLADFCKKEFESGGFVRFDEVITGVGFFDYYESTAAC